MGCPGTLLRLVAPSGDPDQEVQAGTMGGMVLVPGERLDDDALGRWVERSVAFARSEPPKKRKGIEIAKTDRGVPRLSGMDVLGAVTLGCVE